MIKLNRFNPTAKLIANVIILITCVVIFDHKTMLALLCASILFGLTTNSFTKKNLKALIPFLLFALAMLWMNALWARVENAQVIGSLGPLEFTDKGLIVGLSLCFRVLTIGITSTIFTTNTDPTELMLSLIKQCRLNPGIAYGILTAFRFLPTMETDLATIKGAHRVRNVKKHKWYMEKGRWYKYAIPLLATNIRKAERVALAMEARGFENNQKRTYYKTVYWKKRDTIFVLCTLVMVSLVVSFSAYKGWLVGFKRWQGF